MRRTQMRDGREMCIVAKKNHKKSVQVAKKNNKLSKGTEARSRVASYARPSASSQPISCCSIFISLYTFHRVSSTFI